MKKRIFHFWFDYCKINEAIYIYVYINETNFFAYFHSKIPFETINWTCSPTFVQFEQPEDQFFHLWHNVAIRKNEVSTRDHKSIIKNRYPLFKFFFNRVLKKKKIFSFLSFFLSSKEPRRIKSLHQDFPRKLLSLSKQIIAPNIRPQGKWYVSIQGIVQLARILPSYKRV